MVHYAKSRGKAHQIDADYIISVYEDQNGMCHYSGMRMTLEGPHRISIERLDDSMGYIVGNVVLVCRVFNIGHGRTFNREKLDFLLSEHQKPHGLGELMEDPHLVSTCKDLARWARSHSKLRQRKRPEEDHSYMIHYMEVLQMVYNQDGCCAYSGVPLNFRSDAQDFRASLERFDTSKGYFPGNVAVVCLELNDAEQVSKELVSEWREQRRKQNVGSSLERGCKRSRTIPTVGSNQKGYRTFDQWL